MAKSLIGIEINDDELRMVQTSPKAIVAVRHMPENLVRNSVILSRETLSELIREMWKAEHFSGKNCAVILPDSSTFFRSISSTPPVSEERLRLNLPYEFRDYVGNESIDYNYDYSVVNTEYDENGEVASLDLIAAAGHRSTIAEYETLLKNAGLRLKLALPKEVAFINLLKAAGIEAEENHACAFADIGYERTMVFIFNGSSILASRAIDIGCRSIDSAVASELNIDEYLAASYRESNHDSCLELPSCVQVYDRIALEIMKAVNFFVYENPQIEFNTIYFGGTGADNSKLTETVLDYIKFLQLDTAELLPGKISGEEKGTECALAVGVTLQ